MSLRSSTKFCLIILLFLQACNKIDVYEQTKSFNKQKWESANKQTFNVTLNDSADLYNLYVVLRHTDAYHFNNMWINLTTISPGDKAQTQRLNLQLANNTKGWLGTVFDDIIEQRILLNNTPVHLKPGNYTFTMQHIMREDPLQYIQHAGIRIEKVTL